MNKDAGKWAVSRSRSTVLARSNELSAETGRFHALGNSVRELSTETEVVEEIGKLWGEAQEKFLAIGRYLVRAKDRFHRSYEATILPRLPFGKGVAYQLRSIALAVDGGKLAENELPHSYATAYQLVSLPDAHLDLARKENLVRKDVLRREVEAFRVKLRPTADNGREASLVREWHRLRAERTRIDERLRLLEQELGPRTPGG